jgi:hypothetical protein
MALPETPGVYLAKPLTLKFVPVIASLVKTLGTLRPYLKLMSLLSSKLQCRTSFSRQSAVDDSTSRQKKINNDCFSTITNDFLLVTIFLSPFLTVQFVNSKRYQAAQASKVKQPP